MVNKHIKVSNEVQKSLVIKEMEIKPLKEMPLYTDKDN